MTINYSKSVESWIACSHFLFRQLSARVCQLTQHKISPGVILMKRKQSQATTTTSTLYTMWRHVIFLQSGMQRFRPFKILYSPEIGFHENTNFKEKSFSFVLDLNLILLFVMSLIGFKSFLTDTPDKTNKQSVKRFILKGVLQLMFVGTNCAYIFAGWTIRYRYKETIWMLNQAYSFSRQRKPSIAQDGHSSLFTLVTWSTVIAVAFACLISTLMPFVYNSTPAHILLSIFWKGSGDNLIKTIACAIYLGTVTSFASILAASCLVYTCAGHFETPFLLTNPANYKANEFTFRKERLRYQAAYLFIRSFNTFGFTFWPVLMMAGFCINVASSFVCIKYHASLSAMLVGFFFGFDISVVVVTLGLHTFSVISLEASQKFLNHWKRRIRRKAEIKQLRACPRIVVKIGAFFDLERKVLLLTLDQIVDQTVALLILA